jgi:hypothetical protein
MKLPRLVPVLIALSMATTGWSESLDKMQWVEGGRLGGADGATRDYINGPLRLAWSHHMGDWVDAEGQGQGKKPFATIEVPDGSDGLWFSSTSRGLRDLVSGWMTGRYPNQGIIVVQGAAGKVTWVSLRESKQAPELWIDGKRYLPVADTFLSDASYRSYGTVHEGEVSAIGRALIRWDLPRTAVPPQSVELRLHSSRQYSGGTGALQVFRVLGRHDVATPPIEYGVAARFPGDVGIERDPAIIFRETFKPGWNSQPPWEHTGHEEPIPVGFNTVMCVVEEGQNGGAGEQYILPPGMDEASIRYYIRPGRTWYSLETGGKIPGFTTVSEAYPGGQGCDPTTEENSGATLRGGWASSSPVEDPTNPYFGATTLGGYIYNRAFNAQPGQYCGEGLDAVMYATEEDDGGIAPRGEWTLFEMYVKLNTPGSFDVDPDQCVGCDGVVKIWIDGRLQFERYDLYWRDQEDLDYWLYAVYFNVYHGGRERAPHDMALQIRDLVVSDGTYIGPKRERRRPGEGSTASGR